MQMLLEQQPLPTLLMRTVIKALRAYPRLENFVLNNILQRCIVKQVWSQKAVWEGFVKCCQQTMPKSFPVLLQLPPAHLRTVFEDCPPIRPAMRAYVQALNEQQLAHIPGSVYELIMAPPPTPSPAPAPETPTSAATTTAAAAAATKPEITAN